MNSNLTPSEIDQSVNQSGTNNTQHVHYHLSNQYPPQPDEGELKLLKRLIEAQNDLLRVYLKRAA